MPPSDEEYEAEGERRWAILWRYMDPISSKLYDHKDPLPLTKQEQTFFNLFQYLVQGLYTNGDVFGYMGLIVNCEDDFALIGAKGTLSAMKGLMPYYRKQQGLKDYIEKCAYWRQTREEREPIESQAEGVHDFSSLLLSYTEKHLPKPEEPQTTT